MQVIELHTSLYLCFLTNGAHTTSTKLLSFADLTCDQVNWIYFQVPKSSENIVYMTSYATKDTVRLVEI